jgi:hypothetical protein
VDREANNNVQIYLQLALSTTSANQFLGHVAYGAFEPVQSTIHFENTFGAMDDYRRYQCDMVV